MTVAGKLRELASEKCGSIGAQDVRIGLGYTGVQLEDGCTGGSYTFGRNSFSGCSEFKGKSRLTGRLASDLVQFLASANALINVSPTGAVPGNVQCTSEVD